MLNDRLFDLLDKLDSDELDQVWAHLGKAAKSEEFDRRARDQKIEPVSRELRHLAANSIADLVLRRDANEYSWAEILHQIADKLDVKVPSNSDAGAVEDALLQRLSAEASKHRNGSSVNDARKASEIALDLLTSKSRWKNYKWLRLFKSIVTVRPAWGPNYGRLVPAVFYVLSAARTHDALKGVTQ